ncbi:hypothetical protein ACQKQD_18970 [Methylobacterium sp. NPDC080182]
MFWLGFLAGFVTFGLIVFGLLMWFAVQDLREEDKEREASRRLEDGGDDV